MNKEIEMFFDFLVKNYEKTLDPFPFVKTNKNTIIKQKH